MSAVWSWHELWCEDAKSNWYIKTSRFQLMPSPIDAKSIFFWKRSKLHTDKTSRFLLPFQWEYLLWTDFYLAGLDDSSCKLHNKLALNRFTIHSLSVLSWNLSSKKRKRWLCLWDSWLVCFNELRISFSLFFIILWLHWLEYFLISCC